MNHGGKKERTNKRPSAGNTQMTWPNFEVRPSHLGTPGTWVLICSCSQTSIIIKADDDQGCLVIIKADNDQGCLVIVSLSLYNSPTRRPFYLLHITWIDLISPRLSTFFPGYCCHRRRVTNPTSSISRILVSPSSH